MAKRKNQSKSGIIVGVDPWGSPVRGMTAQGYIARDMTGDGRRKNVRKNIRDEIWG